MFFIIGVKLFMSVRGFIRQESTLRTPASLGHVFIPASMAKFRSDEEVVDTDLELIKAVVLLKISASLLPEALMIFRTDGPEQMESRLQLRDSITGRNVNLHIRAVSACKTVKGS